MNDVYRSARFAEYKYSNILPRFKIDLTFAIVCLKDFCAWQLLPLEKYAFSEKLINCKQGTEGQKCSTISIEQQQSLRKDRQSLV